LFSEAAPETSKKVTRDDVTKAAESLVKQAVKVAIFWAASTPPKAAEAAPLLSDFHDSFVASMLLLHACSAGAAATWHAAIRSAAEGVVSAATALLDTALTTTNATQRAQLLPRQVGVLQSAYAALKKLPVSNEAAVGRALVTLAASMKDVAREVGEMVGREGVENGAVGVERSEEKGDVEGEGSAVEGRGVQERPREKDSKEEEDSSSNDKEEEDGDGGDGGDGDGDDEDEEEEEASLGEEERELARSGLHVCVAAEGVIRCLIYLVAAWQQHQDSWGQQQQQEQEEKTQSQGVEGKQQQEQKKKTGATKRATGSGTSSSAASSSASNSSNSSRTSGNNSGQNSSSDILESVLRVCMGASEDVDEIGASLFPPQEPGTIRMRAQQLLGRARDLKSLLPLPPGAEALENIQVADSGSVGGAAAADEGKVGSGGEVGKKGVGKGGMSVSKLHEVVGEMERDIHTLLHVVGEESSEREVVGDEGAQGIKEGKREEQVSAACVTVTIEKCRLDD
ncbi:unnamed protein product, partial [Closterium sp. NIES-53]